MREWLLVLGVVAGLSGCDVSPKRITYSIGGTARSANVTLTNSTGAAEQVKVTVPWSRSLTIKSGTYVYLTGQSDGPGGVWCTIAVEGEQFRTSVAGRIFRVATCSGPVPENVAQPVAPTTP